MESDWEDSGGFGCEWYAQPINTDGADGNSIYEEGDTRCDLWGDAFANEYTANEVCCVCGGGVFSNLPPVATPGVAPKLPSPAQPPNNHQATTTMFDECMDYPNWYDAQFNTCQWYELSSHCRIWGDQNLNFGKVANSACCVCGGGFKRPPTPSPSYNPTEAFTHWPTHVPSQSSMPTSSPKPTSMASLSTAPTTSVRPSNVPSTASPTLQFHPGYRYNLTSVFRNAPINAAQTCFDEYEWRDTVTGRSCSDYENDGSRCTVFGHLQSEEGVTGFEGCCACDGGFEGDLRSMMLRIAFPSDDDQEFTLNTTLDGGRNGTIVQFMDTVAQAHGFGLVEYNLLDYLQGNDSGLNSYDACLSLLALNELDVCVGPFYNFSETAFIDTAPLYAEKFHLVVTVEDNNSLNEFFRTPPFTWEYWLFFLGSLVVGGIALDIIRNGFSCASYRGWERISWIGSILFERCMSCLERTDEIEAKKERTVAGRILAVFFAIFSILSFAIFTSSLTAAFVNDTKGPRFTSLRGIIESGNNATICMNTRIYDAFVHAHNQARDVSLSMNRNTNELLDMLITGECDSVIVSSAAYEAAARKNADLYCSREVMLRDELLLSADIILPISANLNSLGSELRDRMNHMIASEVYMRYHREAQSQYPRKLECFQRTMTTNDNALAQSALYIPAIIACAGSIIALIYHFSIKKMLTIRANRDKTFKMIRTRAELRSMRPSRLVQKARKHGIPADELKYAMNALPDKKFLVDVVFKAICRDFWADWNILAKLRVSDLHEILDSQVNEMKSEKAAEEFNVMIDDALNSSDVKTSLMNLIMSHEDSKNAALSLARRSIVLDSALGADELDAFLDASFYSRYKTNPGIASDKKEIVNGDDRGKAAGRSASM